MSMLLSPRSARGAAAILALFALFSGCGRDRPPNESEVRAALTAHYDIASLEGYEGLMNVCVQSFRPCRDDVLTPDVTPSVAVEVQEMTVKHVGRREALRDRIPGAGYFTFEWWPARVEVHAVCTCDGQRQSLVREWEYDIAPGAGREYWYVRD
jgi:hypothetical protein